METTAEWQRGTAAEIDFWTRWSAGGTFEADLHWRTNPDSAVQELLTQFLDDSLTDVRILDVGAGPLTIVGKRWGDRKVTIEASDALANQYAPGLAAQAITPLVETQQCYTESLEEVFPTSTYDLVFARNTLDHSLDPIEAMRSMCRVAKPGGVILTQHAENEGLSESYAGLHGWNFSLENDQLLVWNETERFDVSQCLQDVADPIRTWSEEQGGYTLVFGAYRRRG